jgi:hypothetical protein
MALTGFLLSAPLWKDKAPGRPPHAGPSSWAAGAALLCFAGLARAAVSTPADQDPAELRRLASALYARGSADGKPDAAALRASLGLSLAAVELRPFDGRSLALAGAALSGLGREADARHLFERSKLVEFMPVIVRRPGGGESEARRLAELKSMGLLPWRLENQ